jgi:hypothetical protein
MLKPLGHRSSRNLRKVMRRKQKWAIRFEQGKNMGGETPLKFRSNV